MRIVARELAPDPVANMPCSLRTAAEMTQILAEAFAEQIARLEAVIARQGEALAEIQSNPPASYHGVWEDGRTYDPGSLTTLSGSMWHCNERTTARPGASRSWTLAVKKGQVR